FVMQEAGRHVTVLVDGQGSDELLAGYAGDAVFYLADRIRSGRSGPRWFAELCKEASDLTRIEGSRPWFLITALRRYRSDPRRHGDRPFTSQLNNVLWNGLRTYGLPELLHSEDALSMAFSVESRPPFLDHRLVEFCFRLPFWQKISGGWTKSLLRRSLSAGVPAEILARRRKMGFSSPISTWLRLEDNACAVRELLIDAHSAQRGLFSPRAATRPEALSARPAAVRLDKSARRMAVDHAGAVVPGLHRSRRTRPDGQIRVIRKASTTTPHVRPRPKPRPQARRAADKRGREKQQRKGVAAELGVRHQSPVHRAQQAQVPLNRVKRI